MKMVMLIRFLLKQYLVFMNNNFHKGRGFTFIEIMIALGVISLVMPVMFSIFFVVARQQSKVFILQEVKRNGDNALNVIQTLSRQYGRTLHSDTPATQANSICVEDDSTYSDDIYIKDAHGDTFHFLISDSKIASLSARVATGTTETVFLTTDKVSISNFSLLCEKQTPFDPPILTISFTSSQRNPDARPDESASLNYQTKIKLKN